MKKNKIFLLFALGVIVGVLASAGLYFLTVGEVAWQQYVEDKLVPNVVFVATTIASLYIACSPLFAKVKAAIEKFGKATDGVCATAKKDEDLMQDLRMICSDNTKLYEGLCQMKDSLEKDRAAMQMEINKLNSAVRIAFCNNRELVEKGIATEIAKLFRTEKTTQKEVSDDEQSAKL